MFCMCIIHFYNSSCAFCNIAPIVSAFSWQALPHASPIELGAAHEIFPIRSRRPGVCVLQIYSHQHGLRCAPIGT